MLALAAITARIVAQVSGFRTVTGLADLLAAKGMVKAPPACYVAPGQESAQPNPMTGRVTQRVTETFSVWIAVAAGASATGEAAQASLKTLVDATRAALVGWQPSAAYLPFELVSAGPIQWDDGQTLFWPETYRTEYYLEN